MGVRAVQVYNSEIFFSLLVSNSDWPGGSHYRASLLCVRKATGPGHSSKRNY